MKRTLQKFIIACTIALCCHHSSNAQNLIGKVYITTSDQIAVFGLDDKGNLDSARRYSARGYSKFSVVGFDEQNNVLITFWRYPVWHGNTKSYVHSDTITKKYFADYQDSLQFIGAWANYKRFAINPRILNSSAREYFGSKTEFTWGVMTLPIKARFGNHDDKFFDFEERLNLGFAFGMKKQLRGYVEQSMNYLIGFGITNVKTDSISLKDVSMYDGKNSLALTLHGGVMYQFDSFQVGLFLGTDFVPGSVGRTWVYQGKPWIGLAIGISLFSKNNATPADNDQTQ